MSTSTLTHRCLTIAMALAVAPRLERAVMPLLVGINSVPGDPLTATTATARIGCWSGLAVAGTAVACLDDAAAGASLNDPKAGPSSSPDASD